VLSGNQDIVTLLTGTFKYTIVGAVLAPLLAAKKLHGVHTPFHAQSFTLPVPVRLNRLVVVPAIIVWLANVNVVAPSVMAPAGTHTVLPAMLAVYVACCAAEQATADVPLNHFCVAALNAAATPHIVGLVPMFVLMSGFSSNGRHGTYPWRTALLSLRYTVVPIIHAIQLGVQITL
jgi:hypothetical protein